MTTELITGRVRESDPLPPKMQRLELDDVGRPIPFFATMLNGKHDFRVVTTDKLRLAVESRLCWVCGSPMQARMTFVVGPMCTVSRTAADPPAHHECAAWSARNCPFMANPQRDRREAGLPDEDERVTAGIMITRNPGVSALWTTKKFTVFLDPTGKPLMEMGDPETIEWIAEGREATREEVLTSMETGLPALREVAVGRPRELKELEKRVDELMKWVPA